MEALKMADALVPGIAAGQIIGRLGCFTRGCCYGLPSEKFGVIFPAIGDGVKYFPAQLIEAAGLAVIFILLNSVKESYKGRAFFLYLLLYGILRFFIEFTRGDFRGPSFLGLSISQFISAGLAAAAVILILKYGKRPEDAA